MREVSEVLLEKVDPFKKEARTSTDEDPLLGTSSQYFKEPQNRGRTLNREPCGHHDSMTLERDISCASMHTVSSSKNKKKSFKETLARSRSLLAERSIPGHVSRTTRKTQEPYSTLKGNPTTSRDPSNKQHHQ